jgi:hypothetical protein
LGNLELSAENAIRLPGKLPSFSMPVPGTIALLPVFFAPHNCSLISTIAAKKNALPLFILIQCLDILTTLVFLSKGIAEGNPLVSWALSSTHSPWIGLVIAKLIAALIGQYCHRSGRLRLLQRANAGYSLVVGWNLVAIAAGMMAH